MKKPRMATVARWSVLMGILAALFLGVSSASASSQPMARTSIIGGTPTSTDSFPFVVLILISGKESAWCSGSVVSPNMILTAAHCVLNEEGSTFRDPSEVAIVSGASALGVGGTVSQASRLAIDPNYYASGLFIGWHDAGLIELTKPISAPAVAIAISEVWKAGSTVTAVGWGDTDPSHEEPSSVLRVGTTVVQSKTYCQRANGLAFHYLAQLCTLDYPTYATGTCQGDSGGPLLYVPPGSHEYVEIGITSRGPVGCPTNGTRLLTRADVEAAWINREIVAHPPPLPNLTHDEAKRDTFNVLREAVWLRSRFNRHSSYRVSCSRINSTKQQCGVNWYQAPNDYYGYLTIYVAWEGVEPVWSYQYTIRSVSDRCYYDSGHPGRCVVQTHHG